MAKTYREQFDEAMKCTTRDEATVWLAHEAFRYKQEFGTTPEEAVRIIKVNLGYMAGYYDSATAQKVKDLFDAVHPVFGDRHEMSDGDKVLAGIRWASGRLYVND